MNMVYRTGSGIVLKEDLFINSYRDNFCVYVDINMICEYVLSLRRPFKGEYLRKILLSILVCIIYKYIQMKVYINLLSVYKLL
jgi:hypothetical protein